MATNASRRDDATLRQRGGSREQRGGGTGRDDRPAPQGEISKWEWLVGGVGLALLLVLIAFLARAAMTAPTPPDLVTRVDSVSRVSSGWLAHVRVRNTGSETAMAVTVEGELATAAGDTLRSETTLDYVPGRSERSGGLLFSEDPRAGTLEVRAIGYQEP